MELDRSCPACGSSDCGRSGNKAQSKKEEVFGEIVETRGVELQCDDCGFCFTVAATEKEIEEEDGN